MTEESIVKLSELIERYKQEIKTFGFPERPVYVSSIANEINVSSDDLMKYFDQRPEYETSPVSYITKRGISDYILIIR